MKEGVHLDLFRQAAQALQTTLTPPAVCAKPYRMESYKQIGKVTSESVRKATGKGWDQWVAILDKAGARVWTHQEIVAFLKKKYKLRPWWQQGVTLGFEIAIGRRVEGQNAKGEYSLTVTKSLALDATELWKILISEQGIRAWLKPLFAVSLEPGVQFETEDGYFGEIRTMKEERRIRLNWQDPNWERSTTVQLTLVPKPKGKSIFVVDHQRIKDLKTQSLLRKRWKSVAEELFQALPPR